MSANHSAPNDGHMNDEALQWVVTLTSGNATSKIINECQQWRRQSIFHEHAFQEARQLWLSLGQSQHLQLLEFELEEPGSRFLGLSVFHLRVLLSSPYFYILAMLFALLCAYAAIINTRHDYKTDFGQIQTVDLSDGSQVTLNTASSLDVNLTAKQREATLDKGEAYFNIAAHGQPFVVKSDDSVVVATTPNTAFSVQHRTDQVIITLIRGSVQVKNKAMAIPHLQPNQQVVITKNQPFKVEHVNAAQVLSWREGMLNFSETTLKDILQTLRYYDKRKWLIYMGHQTADTTLNTTVNIKDMDAWLDGISNVLPVKTKQFGPFLIVYD